MSNTTRKKIVLLGSTGSIGTSTLSVAKALPSELEIIGIAAGTRCEDLAQQAIETGAKHLCIYDTSKYTKLKSLVPEDVIVYAGPEVTWL